MLYLIDANVLITANNKYYPINGVPEFWEWLEHVATLGHVKMPLEIFEEVREGPEDDERDLLFGWIQQRSIRDALIFNEVVNDQIVGRVVAEGYGPDLTDDEVEKVGRDPFLIAYAMAAPERRVVTCETSEPRKQRANRKVPDVCEGLEVEWRDPFQFNRELGFSTRWRR